MSTATTTSRVWNPFLSTSKSLWSSGSSGHWSASSSDEGVSSPPPLSSMPMTPIFTPVVNFPPITALSPKMDAFGTAEREMALWRDWIVEMAVESRWNWHLRICLEPKDLKVID